MAVPKRRIAGIAASIPAGYVLGRTQGGEGDVGLISITELGQTMVSSGAVMSGGGGLAAIADLRMLANISGGSAAPVATTNTAWMDATLGSTQGNITYRNSTVWTVLPVATNTDTREAQVKALVQDGSGQNPKWSAVGHYVWKRTVSAATTAPLPACTYNNGTGGIGATLTGNANGALTAQDGITLDATTNNALLVKDQATQTQNGVYWVTQAGDGSHPFILTRMEDLNDYVSGGTAMFFPVATGTTQGQTIWMSAIAQTTFGSDNITFAKVAGAGAAGTGVTSVIAGTNVTISSTGAGGTGAVTVNAPNAGAGNYLGRRVISTTGTYTPTTGTASVNVTIIGGGGAGGGAAATTSVQQAEGSGGGAGGISSKYMTSAFSGVTVTLGAAGASSSGAAGGNGGNSTFGAVLTANGGTGGGLGSATTNTGVAGGAGGTASGGDINVTGSRGWFSSPQLAGGDAISGRGADSGQFGTGGAEQLASAAGIAASGFGAGGSGAINGASQSARAGGNGAAGVCIIDEYGPSAATSGVLSGLTTGKVPYASSSNSLADSEITDTGGTGGVQVGAPTGGAKGSGTLNATNLYVNGVAVATTGGGASGSGLFSGLITPPPLVATFTQFGSPGGADITGGITMSNAGGAGLAGYYTTAPGTPYTRTGLFTYNGMTAGGPGFGLIWSDATKYHVYYVVGGFLTVDKFTNVTTFSAHDSQVGWTNMPNFIWLRLKDDGTTVFFQQSSDGVTFTTTFSIAKASSFLGSGGYTKVGFNFSYTGSSSITNTCTLWSWA